MVACSLSRYCFDLVGGRDQSLCRLAQRGTQPQNREEGLGYCNKVRLEIALINILIKRYTEKHTDTMAIIETSLVHWGKK